MKAPLTDPSVELAILGTVAAVACGLASMRDDPLFVALFGAAFMIAIFGALSPTRDQ